MGFFIFSNLRRSLLSPHDTGGILGTSGIFGFFLFFNLLICNFRFFKDMTRTLVSLMLTGTGVSLMLPRTGVRLRQPMNSVQP